MICKMWYKQFWSLSVISIKIYRFFTEHKSMWVLQSLPSLMVATVTIMYKRWSKENKKETCNTRLRTREVDWQRPWKQRWNPTNKVRERDHRRLGEKGTLHLNRPRHARVYLATFDTRMPKGTSVSRSWSVSLAATPAFYREDKVGIPARNIRRRTKKMSNVIAENNQGSQNLLMRNRKQYKETCRKFSGWLRKKEPLTATRDIICHSHRIPWQRENQYT